MKNDLNPGAAVQAEGVRRYAMLLDGELVDGASSIPVVDPATEEIIAHAPAADASQLEQAVASAKAAFDGWKNVAHAERVALIHRIADAIEARREEIARIITLEVGKPITAARADVDLSLMWARQVAGVELKPDVLQDDEQAYVEVQYKPIGVVAAIIPWNFPFFQTVLQAGAGLADRQHRRRQAGADQPVERDAAG
ncbi:aldehyde dehydrogenase family protein [Thauera sp. SDU_THAU2]|uniref:aldehyde dehydrogenase family protein n=1 Tax=Thauera sp. SDU_THAU2 TaxID=3136633 RepID=UPI00311F8DE4